MGEEQQKYELELDSLRREKDKLERKREKLLEAHYNDAIPLDLLKSEQKKISKQMAAIDSQVNIHEGAFIKASEHLSEAMELIENCGRTYRIADDYIKRMMNQAIFSKLWVESDGRVTVEFREPFTTIIEPIKAEITHFNKEKTRGTEALTDFLSVISNHIQKFFGHGWNNDLLVHPIGFEPTTPGSEDQCSNPLSYGCIRILYHDSHLMSTKPPYLARKTVNPTEQSNP